MKLTFEDFVQPEKHPYDLLGNYEKENNLAMGLMKAMNNGDLFSIIEFNFEHPEMIEAGLFEEVNGTKYRLTKKAVGLLYSVYGK